MTFRVLALASGVTGLEDHRLALNTFAWPNGGGLKVYGGVVPGGFGFTNPSAMVARIASGFALVPGTGTATQGAYILVADANTDITFDNGEAAVTRTDRIIARVYDNTYDATGFTKGSVEYLKGQASGAATALPANSILLYEQNVAAGASAGGTPINFSTITDKRQYLTAVGGIQSVASESERTAMTPNYVGKMVFRRDRSWIEVMDSLNKWRVRSQAVVAGTGSFNTISDPYAGLLVTLATTGQAYTYNGSAFEKLGDAEEMFFHAKRTTNQSIANNTQVTVVCGTVVTNKGGWTYNTSTGALTIPEDGVYTITGQAVWDFNNTSFREMWININGNRTNIAPTLFPTNSGSAPAQSFTYRTELDAGDVVKIDVKHAIGSATTISEAQFTATRTGSGV